jgi:tetratricopeptide (TPR) repeat protein
LDQAERLFTGHPDIIALRFEILCQAGFIDAALAVRAEIAGRNQLSFWVWVQGVGLELDLGNLSAVADALRAPPSSQSAKESARICLLRGQLAEAQWQPEHAVAYYGQAIQIEPDNAWLHQEMSRACLLALNIEEAWKHLGKSLKLGAGAAVQRGQSIKVSQSHLGQIADEFRIDSRALAQLQELRRLPPETRINSAIWFAGLRTTRPRRLSY